MFANIIEQIISYDKITVFRHIRPDGDAMFSALALYQFIKDNFKDKQVKIAGYDKYDVINKSDKISDSFIENSLAIVLDTSTRERIDDNRCFNAKYLIKIDHHPAAEEYGDANYTNSNACACCEYLTDILLSEEFKHYCLSKKTCKYLYCGILTDSMNLTTTSTTAHTYMICSKLAEIGDLKPDLLYRFVFSKDVDTFNKISKIRSYLTINGKFAYILLEDKDLKDIDIDPHKARNNIDELANIKNINVWAFFTYNSENNSYDGSLRSIRGFVVNKIAQKYHGGGHVCAAGTNSMSKEELEKIIKDLSLVANS